MLLSLQADIDSISYMDKAGWPLPQPKKDQVSPLHHWKKNLPSIHLMVNNSPMACWSHKSNILVSLMSQNLSWSPHINSLCLKAKRQLGLLHRHFHNTDVSCRTQLYKSLVLPTLDYCSSLWWSSPTISHLQTWGSPAFCLASSCYPQYGSDSHSSTAGIFKLAFASMKREAKAEA